MKHVIIGVFGILAVASAGAEGFGPSLEQFNHRSFTRLEGAPSSISAIAQTTDGLLWVGSDIGLTRFDGAKFVSYPGQSDEALPSANVSALMSTPDGGLWIGFRLGGVCLLRNGHVTCYGASEGIPNATVWRFAFDSDGTLLIATTAGLLQLRGRVAQRIAPDVIGRAIDALLDHSGTMWVATGGNVVARVKGDSQFHEAIKITQLFDANTQVLAEAPDGHVWVSDAGLLSRRDPTTPELGAVPMRATDSYNGRLLIDTGGNAWFPSVVAGSLNRWPAEKMATDLISPERVVHAETYSKAGLTGVPKTIFEDREHNIWIGTVLGLDRFSPSKVMRAVPPCPGLGYAIVSGVAGELWAACGGTRNIKKDSLLQIRDGKIIAERPVANFSAAFRDSAGTFWFGGPDQVASFDGETFVATPLPDELRGFDVQALAKDGSGALWVSVARHGVYRLVAGQWALSAAAGMPSGPAIVETADDDGGIWFGYPGNRITRLQGQALQQFTAADGLAVGNVLAIHRAAGQVWVGGDVGFSQLHGGRFQSVRTASGARINGVSGIASAKNGDLWLNAIGGIVRIEADEVQQLIRDPNHPTRAEVFDTLDGVPGEPVQLRPIPTAAATADGRVWFETTGGLVWIDATGSSKNNLVPPIALLGLESGGLRFPYRGETLHLPIHTTSLQFEYSAGSLMVPEHVRFRYRLTGLDRDWQDAGGRRDAFYTNLGPGSYTFQVIGSNNDGVWNEAGASMAFTIAPAFYQTAWFRALCAAAVFVLIWVLVQLRLRQLHKHHEALNQSRLELAHVERLATLSAMTASITHEVSQPISGMLTNVNTCVRMLAAEPPNVTGAAETARRAVRDANRAAEVIKRLRAMFAKKAPTMEAVDLNNAAREVIALSSAELRRGGAVLETHFAEFLPPVSGDRVQLQQVILNLLLNAADAMTGIEDREKIIRIQTQLEGGDKAKLLVRDCGIGLDPRGVEKLFEAFHTTKEHGLGIGLAISRSIIESHKGQLWATANDGPGATFSFSIPCASDSVTNAAATK